MCTVTVLQNGESTVITSSRDEKITRPRALGPCWYSINSKRIIFPKDSLFGGTWFCADQHANVATLLNGAKEKHISAPSYGKSRGLILLDIIGSPSPQEVWTTINLNRIEPFTMILLQREDLYQMRWNGLKKETIKLDRDKHYIWSSSTLYSRSVRKMREQWFNDFIENKSLVTQEDILCFHQNTQSNNMENGLKINRGNLLKTLSITQSVVLKDNVDFNYIQLDSKESYNLTYPIV